MKLDKYFNKFNITRNGFILLIVAISLLMLNGKVFSADKNVPNPLTFVNNKVTETLQEPLKRLKNVIDLINLKYQDALSNEVEVQVSPDLKWAFEAEGISLVQPVVNQEDGTVFAATTDIDVNVRVRNLLRRKKSILDIGKLESKLHALKPDTISNKGDKKWTFNVDGVIISTPLLSNDDAFVMSIDGDLNFEGLGEGLGGLEDLEGFLENLEDLANLGILDDIGAKLTAINKNGRKIWNAPVEFDGAFPIGLPVAAPGLILATTFKVPDLSDINNVVANLTGIVSAFNSKTGEEEWSFNPAEVDSESRLIVINTPTVNGNTIFVNAISTAISAKEINDFIELIKTTITNIKDTATTTITDSILELLVILVEGGNAQPKIDEITGELESLINDTIGNITNELPSLESRLFALDTNGERMWDASLSGVSVSSPVVTDSGININTTNISLGDVSIDAELNVELTSADILEVDGTISLLIAGTTINIGLDISLDATSANPLDTLKTEFDLPDLNEALSGINILEGVSATFNETDGELKWQTKIGEPILVKPVTSDGQIIVSTSGFNTNEETGKAELTNPISKVYSIDAANGEINWVSDQIEGTIVPPVLLGPGNGVFLTLFNNGALQVQALDPDDGSPKWANPFKSDNFVTSTPIINPNDGMVFLSTSKTGDLQDFGSSLKDIIPPLTGEIIGLDPSTGAVDKTIEVDGFPLTSPAIDESRDTIYSTTFDVDLRLLRGSLNLLTFVNAADLK